MHNGGRSCPYSRKGSAQLKKSPVRGLQKCSIAGHTERNPGRALPKPAYCQTAYAASVHPGARCDHDKEETHAKQRQKTNQKVRTHPE